MSDRARIVAGLAAAGVLGGATFAAGTQAQEPTAAGPAPSPAGPTSPAPTPQTPPSPPTTPAAPTTPPSSEEPDPGPVVLQVPPAPPAAGPERTRERERAARNRARRAAAEVRARSQAAAQRSAARAGGREQDAAPDEADGALPPAAAPIAIPRLLIARFRIPPFLLPIYQAAAVEYGLRWEVLAAINEIETDYGRNVAVSSAGAQGWMQFMPATWAQYGVDANGDGQRDPYNPVDAIFAAARYLKAAGARDDIRKAIFAYNHADWYVDSVLERARLVAGLPSELVDALTGLTLGRFPVAAPSRYPSSRPAGAPRSGPPGIAIEARSGSRAVAVQDGTVERIGRSRRLGRFVRLRDVYGNVYTYGRLGTVARTHAAPGGPAPEATAAASNGTPRDRRAIPAFDTQGARTGPAAPVAPETSEVGTNLRAARAAGAIPTAVSTDDAPANAVIRAPHGEAGRKKKLFAHPARPVAYRAGGDRQLAERTPGRAPLPTSPGDTGPADADARRQTRVSPVVLAPAGGDSRDRRPLREGSRVLAGSTLGRLGGSGGPEATLRFEVRPAGDGAPLVDPRPILDGWRLLDATVARRSKGADPLFVRDGDRASIGQILLLGKASLQRRVLANPRIGIYPCGRADIKAGIIDRRVLATLEFLALSGLEPTVTSLRCGHGVYTSSGNVSEHTTGTAIDIAAINGIPILGHQGSGSITDQTIRRLLTLPGPMRPHQIISLMTYAQADNTIALPDHADHIHIGFRPGGSGVREVTRRVRALAPPQWTRLIRRLDDLEAPVVRTVPSASSLSDPEPRNGARRGD